MFFEYVDPGEDIKVGKPHVWKVGNSRLRMLVINYSFIPQQTYRSDGTPNSRARRKAYRAVLLDTTHKLDDRPWFDQVLYDTADGGTLQPSNSDDITYLANHWARNKDVQIILQADSMGLDSKDDLDILNI